MTADRHEKWVRVEPGHIIPAGQPWRTEFPITRGCQAVESVSIHPYVAGGELGPVFVDSSWTPPLNLPLVEGGPDKWGFVAFVPKHNPNGKRRCIGGLWSLRDGYLISLTAPIAVETVIDFIEATPEQVTRIEASA